MKLRLRDNSVRLRLTRGEVDAVKRDGLISARTDFPGGPGLCYQLESSPAAVSPETLFSGNVLTVRVPETDVLAWASTDQVSIAGAQRLAGGDELTILVEKDFACLAPREGEDESDMYPHPAAAQGES